MGQAPIVIYGASGHGRVIADIVERAGTYLIVGFLDDDRDLWGRDVSGYRVLGGASSLLNGFMEGCEVVIGVGRNDARRDLAARIGELGYAFGVAVHPSCQVGRDVTLGAGVVVMPNVVINNGAQIGAHAILNTAATVDHDCQIGAFAHLAPGVHLAGNVVVGEGALLGVGASVIPGIHIGKSAVVGAGAVVVRDVPPGATVVGAPARVVRNRSSTEV